MTDIQQGAEIDLYASVEQFVVARDLGQSALRLEKEIKRIRESIDRLAVDTLLLPDDVSVWLERDDKEGHLHAEKLDTVDDPQAPAWVPSVPGYTSYSENVSEFTGYSHFAARSLEYDRSAHVVWGYNADHTFRVRFDDGARMQLMPIGAPLQKPY